VQIKSNGVSNPDEPTERDPLFADAVEIVLETRRGSVSLLQRRLAIGYTRASRLIEEMAQAGIIGIYKGSQAREVTMTLEEWEAMKQQMAADAQAAAATAAEAATDDDTWVDASESDDPVPDEFDDEYRN
jgi:DNA segregation ATPase FtsK/SpoIIIE, S-DNA-T family